MAPKLTRMQTVAREYADVPRRVLADYLGITPAAVTKRLQRAKQRETRLRFIDPSSIAQPPFVSGLRRDRFDDFALAAGRN